MIYESSPWKRELIKDADIIFRWSAKKTNSDYREFVLEKKIFLSAFSIRKLIDDCKITDKVKNHLLPCVEFKKISERNINFTNRHRVPDYFDFSCSTNKRSVRMYDLTNQIIHSVIFIFSFDEGTQENKLRVPVSGFLVSSDRKSNKGKSVYLIGVEDYVKAMRLVGNDDVTSARWERDLETSELKKISQH